MSSTERIWPVGADWSKPLAMSHGRPIFFASACKSRRVMSSPTAYPKTWSRARSAGISRPPSASATTSSISWCRSRVCVGNGSAPAGTTASAGFMKKNGGSRSGSCPISIECSA